MVVQSSVPTKGKAFPMVAPQPGCFSAVRALLLARPLFVMEKNLLPNYFGEELLWVCGQLGSGNGASVLVLQNRNCCVKGFKVP